MKIGYLCLMITCLLPILATGIAKFGDRSYDNRQPRDWLARQTGYRARANAAQANSWEALIVFGLALLSAYQRGASASMIDTLSMVFLAARLAYLGAYLANIHLLRSLLWMVGMAVSIALFLI